MFMGKSSRIPEIGFWGAYGTVIGEVHFSPKPRVETTVVRDGSGKVIKVNFFQYSAMSLRQNKASFRLEIISFSEF